MKQTIEEAAIKAWRKKWPGLNPKMAAWKEEFGEFKEFFALGVEWAQKQQDPGLPNDEEASDIAIYEFDNFKYEAADWISYEAGFVRAVQLLREKTGMYHEGAVWESELEKFIEKWKRAKFSTPKTAKVDAAFSEDSMSFVRRRMLSDLQTLIKEMMKYRR